MGEIGEWFWSEQPMIQPTHGHYPPSAGGVRMRLGSDGFLVVPAVFKTVVGSQASRGRFDSFPLRWLGLLRQAELFGLFA